MYPCCPVPTLESSCDVLSLQQAGVGQMLDGVCEITKQSLLDQMAFVQKFGIHMFKDLVTDIAQVTHRVDNLAAAITEFEKVKDSIFSQLRARPGAAYLQRLEKNSGVPVPDPCVVRLEQANENLEKLLPVLKPDVDFEPWAKIEKCKAEGVTAEQLVKGIHDPDFFVRQLVHEMEQDKKERDDDAGRAVADDTQKGTSGVRTTAKTIEVSEATAMMKAYAGEPPEQDSVLIVPPPPGDPNWKQQALRLATRKKRALATAQEVWLQNQQEEQNARRGFTTEAAAPDGSGRLRAGSSCVRRPQTLPEPAQEVTTRERRKTEK